MLKTPCAFDAKDNLPPHQPKTSSTGTLAQEIVNGIAEKRGLLPTPLTQGLKTCEQGKSIPIHWQGLMPTPMATEVYHRERVQTAREKGLTNFRSRTDKEKDTHPNGILDFCDFHGLLPTPMADEGYKYATTYKPGSQMGESLTAQAMSGMLPTPAARDWKGRTNPGIVKPMSRCKYGETLPDTVHRLTKQSTPPQECWASFPTQSPVCRGNDGLPFDVDYLALPFPQWRANSIKAYGNSMVPQVVFEIFRAIQQDICLVCGCATTTSNNP